MEIAKIRVTDVSTSIVSRKPVTHNINGATVSFVFNPAWDNLKKIIVFRAVVNDEAIEIKDQDFKPEGVRIPKEITNKLHAKLQIGVYGTNLEDKIEIPTLWADLGEIRDSADPSGDSDTDPDLPYWSEAIETAKRAEDIAQSVRDDADAGKFDGEDGKSAYQQALDNGFVGTEQEWLASLKGEKGDPYEHSEEFTNLANEIRANKEASDLNAQNAKESETKAEEYKNLAKASQEQAKHSENISAQNATQTGNDLIDVTEISKTVKANAEQAVVSAAAARLSEVNAADSATSANDSKLAAKTSETNSKTSETNAKTSETNAKTSETNAKTSEINAAKSAKDAVDAVAGIAGDVASSAANAQAAKDSADKAKISENNSKISETNAKSSEDKARAYSEISTKAEEIALSVRTDADAGKFDGKDGKDGKSGVHVGNTPPSPDDNVWIIEDGEASGEPDTEMSDTSTNSVQNKVVKAYVDSVLFDTLKKERELFGDGVIV